MVRVASLGDGLWERDCGGNGGYQGATTVRKSKQAETMWV